MSNFLERMCLILGGAFVALGVEMRGWIEYNRDVEFWLMGAYLGLLFLGDYFRRKTKTDAAETSDPAIE